MCMFVDVSGTQLAGSRESGLPSPFLKIGKNALIMRKNALIVLIHGLNVPLCPHLKCYFKGTSEEKLRDFLSCVVDEMFIEMPLL